MSTCTDSINNNGVVFTAYGAQLVDEEGNITVKSDATRQVLEYFQKLVRFLPESVWAWDNASNNKSLISGQTSLIQNPPSAHAVAKRDAPKIAEQLWTFHSPPPSYELLIWNRTFAECHRLWCRARFETGDGAQQADSSPRP
jgi:hypothetical protein